MRLSNETKNRKVLAVILIIFLAFYWRQASLFLVNNLSSIFYSLNERMALWITYYATIIASSIVGAFVSQKMNQKSYLIYFWVISGIFVLFLTYYLFTLPLLASFLLGASFGYGFPVCLAFFGEHTNIESRGRIGGLSIFISIGLGLPFISLVFASFSITGLLSVSIIVFGVLLLIFRYIAVEETKLARKSSFMSLIGNRTFLYYLIPWAMFIIVDELESSILEYFLKNYLGDIFFEQVRLINSILIAVFGLIGGFLIDSIGRKKVVIYGFVSLGLTYALVGFLSNISWLWYVFGIIDGITWGLFIVIFILTIWGDISVGESKEGGYVIGVLPLFFGSILREALRRYLKLVPVYTSFSFASFFLFLAVIPLIYAPETLPEKVIRRKELRKYVEKAKKIREKYERREKN